MIQPKKEDLVERAGTSTVAILEKATEKANERFSNYGNLNRRFESRIQCLAVYRQWFGDRPAAILAPGAEPLPIHR